MFTISTHPLVSVILQSLHYTLAFTGLLFGLLYYRRQKFTHAYKFAAAMFLSNLLLNYLYIYQTSLYLPTTILNQLINVWIYWRYIDRSIARVILLLGMTNLFMIGAEGLFFPLLPVLELVIKLSHWNDFVLIAMLFVAILILITLPLQYRVGKYIGTATEADLNTFMPLAAFTIYLQFAFHLLKILTTKTNLLPNLLLTAVYTLAFIGFIIWQIRQVTQSMAQMTGLTSVQLGKSIAGNYLSNRHDIKNMLSALAYVNQESVSAETPAPILQAVLQLKQDEAMRQGIHLNIEALNPPAQSDEILSQYAPDHSQNELNAAIILGILLDNAFEHLLTHPNLPKQVTLHMDWHTLAMKVANPIDTKSHAHLEKAFQKGHSSKQQVLTSGFGLYNANLIAARMNRRLQYVFDGDLVVFEVV